MDTKLADLFLTPSGGWECLRDLGSVRFLGLGGQKV